MALFQLYNIATNSANPSSLTNILPGGAGVVVAGSTPNAGISAPAVETGQREVFDVTAPTLITSGVTLGTPAPAGKLLFADLSNGAFGSKWSLNKVKNQPGVFGSYGIVVQAGVQSDAGTCVTTANGNVSQGAKATVIIEGPAQAFVNTTVSNTAISAGMPLASDGAGNLTYAGAAPAAGTVVAQAAGSVGAGISIPVLTNVYVGGY